MDGMEDKLEEQVYELNDHPDTPLTCFVKVLGIGSSGTVWLIGHHHDNTINPLCYKAFITSDYLVFDVLFHPKQKFTNSNCDITVFGPLRNFGNYSACQLFTMDMSNYIFFH